MSEDAFVNVIAYSRVHAMTGSELLLSTPKVSRMSNIAVFLKVALVWEYKTRNDYGVTHALRFFLLI